MASRWDETWHRLRNWTNGQGPSERLAAQILLSEGYTGLDPSHPLGGQDGSKDAMAWKDGKQWVMAVYFPRGQKDFSSIKRKFLDDLSGVEVNNANAIAFVTNQEVTLGERNALKEAAGSTPVELYHLERVTTILDKPEMAEVRKQFLRIDFSGTEMRHEVESLRSEVIQAQKRLEGLQTELTSRENRELETRGRWREQEELDKYKDKLHQLMYDVDRPLLESRYGDPNNVLARELTLSVLKKLSGEGKKEILEFLHRSLLIYEDNPIVFLRDADFSGANLSNVKLPKLYLLEANLSCANLNGAELSTLHIGRGQDIFTARDMGIDISPSVSENTLCRKLVSEKTSSRRLGK